MLKNYMEDVVNSKLHVISANYTDVYKCSKCIDDIKAIVLGLLVQTKKYLP